MTSAKEWANLLWRHAWASEGDVQAIMDASRAEALVEAAHIVERPPSTCRWTRLQLAEYLRALAASPKPRGEG